MTGISNTLATTQRVLLDNLQCSGREGYLSACRGAKWGVVSESCDHSNDAQVICAGIEDRVSQGRLRYIRVIMPTINY